MVQPNDSLQHAHELRSAQRPAVLQHAVIDVLNTRPGEPANEIDRVEHLLKIYEMYFPRRMGLRRQCEALGPKSWNGTSLTQVVYPAETLINSLERAKCLINIGINAL